MAKRKVVNKQSTESTSAPSSPPARRPHTEEAADATTGKDDVMGDVFPSPTAVKGIDATLSSAHALLRGGPPLGISPEAWEPVGILLKLLVGVVEKLSAPTAPNLAFQCEPVQNLTVPAAVGNHTRARTRIPSLFDYPLSHPLPHQRSRANLSVQAIQEEERRRSLVVIGLAEPDAALGVVERNKRDLEGVMGVLGQLAIDVNPPCIHRMGTVRSDGKPRLVKVVLPSPSLVYKALSGAKNLKSVEQYKSVYVRKSLSQQELAHVRTMRAQLATIRKDDPASTFVIYRDEIWKKEEIESGTRVTVPPTPKALTVQGNL